MNLLRLGHRKWSCLLDCDVEFVWEMSLEYNLIRMFSHIWNETLYPLHMCLLLNIKSIYSFRPRKQNIFRHINSDIKGSALYSCSPTRSIFCLAQLKRSQCFVLLKNTIAFILGQLLSICSCVFPHLQMIFPALNLSCSVFLIPQARRRIDPRLSPEEARVRAMCYDNGASAISLLAQRWKWCPGEFTSQLGKVFT